MAGGSLYTGLTKLPIIGGIIHGIGGNTDAENAQQNALNKAATDYKQYQANNLAALMSGYQPAMAAAFSPMQSFMSKWYGPGSTMDVGAAMKGMNPNTAQLSQIYSSAFGQSNPQLDAALTAERQAGQGYSDAERDWNNMQSGGQGASDYNKERMLEAERNYSDATKQAANASNQYFNQEAAFWGPNSGFQAPPAFTPTSGAVNALPDFWKGALNSPYKTGAGY